MSCVCRLTLKIANILGGTNKLGFVNSGEVLLGWYHIPLIKTITEQWNGGLTFSSIMSGVGLYQNWGELKDWVLWLFAWQTPM